MGSDLHMNPPYEPPVPVSRQVKNLEDENDLLKTEKSAIIAEKSRLQEQARNDAETIVRLTRENDRLTREGAALRATLHLHNIEF